MNRRRPAFTLLELLVVLAIIVAIAAVGVLSMRQMQGPYKITGAVDSVRAAWAIARSRAIDESRPYRFSVEPNGRHFRVEPDDEAEGKGAAASHQDSLPAGVRFIINGEPGQLPPESAAVADEKSGPSGQWEKTCVFLPDGTASEDVRIVFQVSGAVPAQLQLRGMTGISYVTRLNGK